MTSKHEWMTIDGNEAVAYVAGAIRHALPLGGGHGPLNHHWRQG